MLLDEIRAHPDDDAPRLVYADSLAHTDPLRGELIALQCAIARGELPRTDAVRARQRVATLLAEHGKRWAPLDGLAMEWTFERGFVETATVDVRVFLARGAELVEAAPLLRTLGVDYLTHELGAEQGLDAPSDDQYAAVDERLQHLFANPHLATITSLAFNRCDLAYTYMGEMSMYDRAVSVYDRILKELASSGVLRRLRGLTLRNVDADTAWRLVNMNELEDLEELELAGNFGHDLQFPTDTPMRPRRISIRDAGDLDLGFLTNPLMTCVTALGDIPTVVAGASLPEPAPIPAELTRRLRELRVTARFSTSLSALAELELPELRELAIEVAAPHGLHRTLGIELLAPLLDRQLPKLRVLGLHGLRVDADLARAIYGSPLVRTCEVIDFTDSDLVGVPDAFGIVVVR